MPTLKQVLLTGVAVLVIVVIYFQMLGGKWSAVVIKHYNGKILEGQEFSPASLAGIEKSRGRKVRAYFTEGGRPVVKAYRDGSVVTYYKESKNGESVEVWRISGTLDGNMKDIVPGGGKTIEGNSHVVSGWTVEWWKDTTKPVKVIIITNPEGKSKTFKIEWQK